jgi:hypothetical protein
MLHQVKAENIILHTAKGRKANWIGYILLKNCLLEEVTEGNIKGSK